MSKYKRKLLRTSFCYCLDYFQSFILFFSNFKQDTHFLYTNNLEPLNLEGVPSNFNKKTKKRVVNLRKLNAIT